MLRLLPRGGKYEAMSQDLTLSFLVAILEEYWGLKPDQSMEVRTQIVSREIELLASAFATKNIGLLSLCFQKVELGNDQNRSMPANSHFTILVRMLSGLIMNQVRKEKHCLACDNAHCLDRQSWTAIRAIFKGSKRNLLLLLAHRPITKDVEARTVAAWFSSAPCTLCLDIGSLSSADTALIVAAIFGGMFLQNIVGLFNSLSLSLSLSLTHTTYFPLFLLSQFLPLTTL